MGDLSGGRVLLCAMAWSSRWLQDEALKHVDHRSAHLVGAPSGSPVADIENAWKMIVPRIWVSFNE